MGTVQAALAVAAPAAAAPQPLCANPLEPVLTTSDRERELARKNISRPQLIADCRRAERDRDHEPSAAHDSRSRRAHVRVPTTRENLLMLRCDVSRPSRRTGHSTQQQHAEHTGARSELQPRVVSRASAQAPRTGGVLIL